MELEIAKASTAEFEASYACPCGCHPGVLYQRGTTVVEEGCCCGNHLAVGPAAAKHLQPEPGFSLEVTEFSSPWGEKLEAAWLVGPSRHAH